MSVQVAPLSTLTYKPLDGDRHSSFESQYITSVIPAPFGSCSASRLSAYLYKTFDFSHSRYHSVDEAHRASGFAELGISVNGVQAAPPFEKYMYVLFSDSEYDASSDRPAVKSQTARTLPVTPVTGSQLAPWLNDRIATVSKT
jgi:hypothetical protein